jgi:DNA-binding transcriptional ArsR family regulator
MGRPAADESVFYAIADPTRRAILDLLLEGERPVKALLERVRTSQSALSQHLGVLRRAGLVGVRREGRLRVYSLRHEPLAEVVDWVAHYERFWEDRLDRLGAYLDRVHGARERRSKPEEQP